jgi:ribonucleoside-diphosphate reductase alpha chain
MEFITDEYGRFPAGFSENAKRIVSAQYFRGGETDFEQTVNRVADGIVCHPIASAWFKSDAHQREVLVRLKDALLNQRLAFNSPVWYNVGITDPPQCSACFIQPVEDSMEGIMELAAKEAMLFKHGSGTGTNLTSLRSSKEKLSNSDGYASGPVSFMKGYDAFAGVIKSGGRTRRAAKMQLLDDRHPDLMEFILCKAEEEEKARTLILGGMSPEEAYASVAFQNANLSVRLTDAFMFAAGAGEVWRDYLGNVMGKADDILDEIARAAWECGDPGVQFSKTINDHNMTSFDGPIRASNPCSEFVFIDDSACNLASLNLAKYAGPYDVVFWDDVRMLALVMDIIVSIAAYPSPAIATNSRMYRPLGIGFTNLAATLAKNGLHYDSDEAREEAALWAKRMMQAATQQSMELAKKFGSYPGFGAKELDILREQCGEELPYGVEEFGVRNAQLTLLAPTGTISFMMDCDSTGIEPVFAASTTKKLASGETIEMVPACFKEHPEAIATAIGSTAVSPDAHLDMMAAVQPYLSGAISKTVNLPSSATVADIRRVYEQAWALKLKCIAVYRDGCKWHQPMEDKDGKEDPVVPVPAERGEAAVQRVRLPETRDSITHKFSVGGLEGYFTVGLYENDAPGEIFVTISKEGSTIGGLMDAWATAVSMGLQYGVPLEKFVRKFKGSRFEPAGFTVDSDVVIATSIVDYIAQWLELRFLDGDSEDEEEYVAPVPSADGAGERNIQTDGNICPSCGGLTVPTGTCRACPNCGWGGGCG